MLGAELGGAVFSCNNQTQEECLALGLLGIMQDAYVPIVQHVQPGMPVRAVLIKLRPAVISKAAQPYGAVCLRQVMTYQHVCSSKLSLYGMCSAWEGLRTCEEVVRARSKA